MNSGNMMKTQNEEINKVCRDCLHECKQSADVKVIYCPLKKNKHQKVGEQLTIENLNT